MAPDGTDIRVRLRALRDLRGTSMAELQAHGCPRASVIQMEAGRNHLRLALVVRLLALYNSTFAYLLGDDGARDAPDGYWADFDEAAYLATVSSRISDAVEASDRSTTKITTEDGFGASRASLHFAMRGERPRALLLIPAINLAVSEEMEPTAIIDPTGVPHV